MNIQKLSEAAGCDLQAAIARLGGMTFLYEKLLKKFTDDVTFHELREAVEKQDPKGIEMYAHTLKGVAANLGFVPLADVSNAIVSAVRCGEVEKAIEYFEECETVYNKIFEAVVEEL